MTTRDNTRSRRSDILAHHRSSQRAAISIPEQLPARRPSGHGYDLADLKYIIPGRFKIAEACHRSMSRNDYLLTLSILGHAFDNDFRFHVLSNEAGMDLRLLCFDRYCLTRTGGVDSAYKYYAITLDGVRVATYWGRTKIDRMTMEPTYIRNLEPELNVGDLLHNMLCPEGAVAYRAAAGELKDLLAIPKASRSD